MTALDGQDGAGGGEVCLVGNGRSSAEVGGDTNAFKDRGELDKGLGVR